MDDDDIDEQASGYYDDDAGVKVHTVPGKPSTIEVEYTGGPIMISVDTQGDSLESFATQQTSDDSSSSSSSSSSDEKRPSRHNRYGDFTKRLKVVVYRETHLRATERHLPYGITCHPTQVNVPCLNTSLAGRYSIYLPWRDGRLS